MPRRVRFSKDLCGERRTVVRDLLNLEDDEDSALSTKPSEKAPKVKKSEFEIMKDKRLARARREATAQEKRLYAKQFAKAKIDE